MEATAGSSNLEEDNKLKQQLRWLEAEEREQNPPPFDRFKRKMLRNPLVPIGCIATITALYFGIKHLVKGNQRKSHLMMRWRVGLQCATITVFIAGVYLEDYLQNKKKL